MGILTGGEVVSLPFPYSDLTRNKVRPVLLIATANASDWIACQITSNPIAGSSSLKLSSISFLNGGLHHVSYLLPGKLFTAEESIMIERLGTLTQETFSLARRSIVDLILGATDASRL